MIGDMLRGAVAGAAATWVMDQVTTAMLSRQPADVTAREQAARVNGQGSVENLVDRLVETFDLDVTDEQRSRLGTAVHYALGAAPGALFGVLRRRVPLVGTGGGLVYGFLLWALNDEYLNTQLGFSAPPENYPPETHWRGLVGHLVLGATTSSGIDLLGG